MALCCLEIGLETWIRFHKGVWWVQQVRLLPKVLSHMYIMWPVSCLVCLAENVYAIFSASKAEQTVCIFTRWHIPVYYNTACVSLHKDGARYVCKLCTRFVSVHENVFFYIWACYGPCITMVNITCVSNRVNKNSHSRAKVAMHKNSCK